MAKRRRNHRLSATPANHLSALRVAPADRYVPPPPPPPDSGGAESSNPLYQLVANDADLRPLFESEGKLFPVLTVDTLSAVTRKQRTRLMVTSLLAVTVVATGFLPSRISTLGVEFSAADRQSLLYIFTVVIVYFATAFAVYAINDLLKVVIGLGTAFGELRQSVDVADRTVELGSAPHAVIFDWLAAAVALLRCLHDFVLPFLVAGFAAITAFAGVVPFGADIVRMARETSETLAKAIRDLRW